MSLTPAEMNFMTNYTTELCNFDRPMPAMQMFHKLRDSGTRSLQEYHKAIKTLWNTFGRNSPVQTIRRVKAEDGGI
ncbi:MAG: hypothetical protein ACLQVF_38995 [Isosphaeraceae bacterium]